MRASWRHDGAFSRRDSVGWLIAALGEALTGQLEGRIETRSIKIVAILIAAGDGEHPGSDHVGMAVSRARRVAFIGQARCQQFGQAVLDFAQQQNAAIRRQPSAIEPGAQFLARDG